MSLPIQSRALLNLQFALVSSQYILVLLFLQFGLVSSQYKLILLFYLFHFKEQFGKTHFIKFKTNYRYLCVFALLCHLGKPFINSYDCTHIVDVLDLCIISTKCELKLVKAT